MILKQKTLLLMMVLGTFLVSCAPPFETKNSKSQTQAGSTSLGQSDNERSTFDVPPVVSPELIRQLPEAEQRVGTGANTVRLGQLEITESRIHRLEDGKLLKFTGKGKVRDRRFDIDLSGRVDSEGKARMFPAENSSRANDVSVRGMGVCLDLVGTRFYCRSLFVEVYVRVGNETFSEQFVLRNTSQGAAATPQREAQVPAVTSEAPAGVKAQRPGGPKGSAETVQLESEQEAPRGLTPEQQVAETDIEHEGPQQAPPESDESSRGGRFVGFRDDVDNLFRAQSDQGAGAVSPATPSLPEHKPAPAAPAGSPAGSVPPSSSVKPGTETSTPGAQTSVATTAEEAAGVPIQPVEDQENTDSPRTTVDANVQQVGGFVLQVSPSRPVQTPVPQAAVQRPRQQAAPAVQQQPAPAVQQQARPVVHQVAPHPAAVLGDVADQARGCYNPGLGAACRSGGVLRNANQLPQSGLGFRVLYPQRQMNFGTKMLVDLLIDLGRKIHEMMPGYQLPISDMSSQFGGRFGARRDGGHQNGLEVDLAYITTTSPPPLVVVVTGSFRREIMKMDEQLTAWKHVVKTNLVSRIFVDRQVKSAFCQYTNRMTQDTDLIETLRRLQPWDGHKNHWHLRLKCPASSPRCQDDAPLVNRTGC